MEELCQRTSRRYCSWQGSGKLARGWGLAPLGPYGPAFSSLMGSRAFICLVFFFVLIGLFLRYAIKKIKCSAETDEEIRREVALMASLGGHRNIVRYYGGQLVAPGGFFWIVMEHMECGTLVDVMALQEAALTEGEVAAVLRDVCSGLGYLHNLGFLHKDIKYDVLFRVMVVRSNLCCFRVITLFFLLC
jgi:hypothetical protein